MRSLAVHCQSEVKVWTLNQASHAVKGRVLQAKFGPLYQDVEGNM